MKWLVNPLWGKTINWRAGCGRSASPVRREGETNKPFLPTPIGRLSVKAHGLRSMGLLELAMDEHRKEPQSIEPPMVILPCFRV